MNIALYGKDINERWSQKISQLLNALSQRSVCLFYFQDLYDCLETRVSLPEGVVFNDLSELEDTIDVFFTLGGDGTFLSSLTHVKDSQIPVLGVNFGRLGFLTSAEISETENGWIDRLINNDFLVEHRPVLEVSENVPSRYTFALNEVYIHRLGSSMMSVDVKIDGVLLPRYWADGILVATPTGSTAYSLSLGGPIVTLGSNIFIISPISPHNLNVRPLIISDQSVIEMEFTSRDNEMMISLDNRHFRVGVGEKIVVKKAGFELNSISFSESNFFTALSNKLFWGKDERNMINKN